MQIIFQNSVAGASNGFKQAHLKDDDRAVVITISAGSEAPGAANVHEDIADSKRHPSSHDALHLNPRFALNGFAELPSVLIGQAMSFLDGRSALRLGEVCRLWRAASNVDRVWERVLKREMPWRGSTTHRSWKHDFVSERTRLFERCALFSIQCSLLTRLYCSAVEKRSRELLLARTAAKADLAENKSRAVQLCFGWLDAPCFLLIALLAPVLFVAFWVLRSEREYHNEDPGEKSLDFPWS